MRFSRSIFSISTVTCFLMLASGCAYIIPPEQNAPRNNTLRGDTHRPQLNDNAGRPQSTAPTRTPVVVQQAVAPIEPVKQASNDLGQRRVPVENQSFQVSSMGYPPINEVPPRPAMSGPGSTRENLNQTRDALEQDRINAQQSRDALARDAAAEPSMLSDLPKTDGVVPPADPVRTTPLAPLPPQSIAPSVTVPAPASVKPEPRASATPTPVAYNAYEKAQRIIVPATPMQLQPLPPSPQFAPPPPKMATIAPAQAPVKVTARNNALQPIVLKAPTDSKPVEVDIAATPSVNNARITGDFDPLAVADNAPLPSTPSPTTTFYTAPSANYVSNKYVAPSRYYDQRY